MAKKGFRVTESSLIIGILSLLLLHHFFSISDREIEEWVLKSIFAGTVIVIMLSGVKKVASKINIPLIKF